MAKRILGLLEKSVKLFSKTNNEKIENHNDISKKLLNEQYLRQMKYENKKICFKEHLTEEELKILVEFFEIKLLFSIDKTLIDYVDNNYFIKDILFTTIPNQRKLIKKNINNHDFLRKVFAYSKDNKLFEKEKIKLVENVNLVNEENNIELTKLLYEEAPYVLVKFVLLDPHYLDDTDINSLFKEINYKTMLKKKFKYYLCSYIYLNKNSDLTPIVNILKTLPNDGSNSRNNTNKFQEFLNDLCNQYEEYTKKTIDFLIENNILINANEAVDYKNIYAYGDVIGNKKECFRYLKAIRIMHVIKSEKDLIYYYKLKKWPEASKQLFIKHAEENNMSNLLEIISNTDAELLKDLKLIKANIKTFINNIQYFLNNDEVLKYLLNNTFDIQYLHKLISTLPEEIITDQKYIKWLYENFEEGKYKYYYFKDMYIAFVILYRKSLSTFFSYWNDAMAKDIRLYQTYCENNIIDAVPFKYGLCDEYVRNSQALSVTDLNNISKSYKDKFYQIYAYNKYVIVKILSLALKNNTNNYYIFPRDRNISFDDYKYIIEKSKWPFFYNNCSLFDYDYIYHNFRSKELLELIDVFVKNMIEYSLSKFNRLVDLNYFLPNYPAKNPIFVTEKMLKKSPVYLKYKINN